MEEQNFFEILGLTEHYNIDIALLNANYLKKQLQCHPDQFVTKTKAEQDIAEHNSSIINRAYEVIKHPITRAEYILNLKGFEIAESNNNVSPILLEEAMSWREKLEDAQSGDRAKNLYDAIESLYNDNIEELGNLLEQNLYQDAFNILINIKFVVKLLDYAKQKLKI